MTKILLVEDDKSLREIYGVRLLAEGYDIVSAGDGEEALAMAIKERPQLIVSDVMMPKISGFDMLDILRSTTETKDIKVIMMTALSSEDQRARGQALGADKYLVKSQVGIEDVVRVVHEVLADAPISGQTPAFGSSTPSAAARPVAPVPPRPGQMPPAAPVAYPSAQPHPTSAPSRLPQPTAPFSTPRPSSTLGERVIHPITPQGPGEKPDFSSLMDQELKAAGTTTPAPIAPAVPPITPLPAAPIPAPFTPNPVSPTPVAPSPVTPSPIAVPPAPTPSPAPYPPAPSVAPLAPQPPTPSAATTAPSSPFSIPPTHDDSIHFEETPRPPTPPNPFSPSSQPPA